MKKLLLYAILGVFAMSLTQPAMAQKTKLTKEEKAALKAKKDAEQQAAVLKFFTDKSFTFVASEYESNSGGKQSISSHQYVRIHPTSFEINLPYTDPNPLILSRNGYTTTRSEQLKNSYAFTIDIDNFSTLYTLEFKTDLKNGLTTLKIKSNKSMDLNYYGTMKSN